MTAESPAQSGVAEAAKIQQDGDTTGLFENRISLTAKEAAAALGMKLGAFYVAVHRGQIPGVRRRGRRLEFFPDKYRAGLHEKRKGASHVSR